MRGPSTLQVCIAAVGVLWLTACVDDQPVLPPSRESQPAAAAAPAPAPQEEQYPDHWWHRYRRDLELLELIPGYAGSFQEDLEGRSIVVLLENPESQAQIAREVLGSRPWNGLDLLPTEIRVIQAQFGLIDLIRWHEILGPALMTKHEAVTMAGVDFRANRVFIGVTADANQQAMRNDIQALGIPVSAVSIEVGGPVILDIGFAEPAPAQTLTLESDAPWIRPGYQIECDRPLRGNRAAATLGIIIDTEEVGRLAGTVAHCTGSMQFVNLDPMAQATFFGGGRTGEEVYTSPYREMNEHVECIYPQGCKWSDFSLFSIETPGRFDGFGKVQRTLSGTQTSSNLYSTFNHILPNTRPSSGTTLRMIGKNTGESTGQVSATCVDIEVHIAETGEDVVILCQVLADYPRQNGDSGLPLSVGRSAMRTPFTGCTWVMGTTTLSFPQRWT